LNDDNFIIKDGVDQAVLIIDPTRPHPRKLVLQRLGFAQAVEGRALNVLDELTDAFQRLKPVTSATNQVRVTTRTCLSGC